MINNRLFKKINAIFWGILTWLPIVLLILSTFIFDLNPQIDSQMRIGEFMGQFVEGASEIMSNNSDLWFNPISSVLYEISNILDTVGSGPFHFILIDITGWVCWVQVLRLLAYVFYWFIDFISGLFDYLSLKRKGDV